MDIRSRASHGLIVLLVLLLSPAARKPAPEHLVSTPSFGSPVLSEEGLASSRFPEDRARPEDDARGMPTPVATNYVAPIPQWLHCSPAPCVLPNVGVSAGPKPVNETTIVVNPANPKQLLSSANDVNCSANAQGLYTSNDGGNTWLRACMGNMAGAYGGGDPGAGYDLQGNAYVTGLEYGNVNGVVFEKSSDNGKTWSAPSVAATSLSGLFVDKDWLHIDTNPESPYASALYVSVTQYDSSGDTLISVSHSNDGGANWTTVAVEPYQPYPITDSESYLASGPDGTVYLAWLRCKANPANNGCGGENSTIEFSKSSDGGTTWTTPVAIVHTREAPYIKCKSGNFGGFFGVLPNTCDRVGNTPRIAVDNSSGEYKGNLYLTYYGWTGKFLKLLVATSTDGGTTWKSKAVTPARDTHDQFFPWVSVSSKGIVGVSWLDRRDDPANTNYEAFAAFSQNGGASFGKNIKLSAQPSNPFNDGWGLGLHFMGDYTGNAWSPNGKTFYVTYTDTTTNVDQDFLTGIQF